MRLAFRWFGPSDPVSLDHIAQIPTIADVVTALTDVAPNEVWPDERVAQLRALVEGVGLRFRVVESIPVSDSIKAGLDDAAADLEVFCENLRVVARHGVEVVTYNFMPLFDWIRTDTAMRLPDGSTTLAYDEAEVAAVDPWSAGLPAYFPLVHDFHDLLEAYRSLTEDDLWTNLERFLGVVVPVAEELGIALAIHPDDPPWSILGIPRVAVSGEALWHITELIESAANGVCLCTGSLGADPSADLPAVIRRLGNRIKFAHMRNIRHTDSRQFHETGHPVECGDIDMAALMEAYHEIGFAGPIRPDHGRMIWGESGQPGYGLYDRALGASYLRGLWDGVSAAHRSGSAS